MSYPWPQAEISEPECRIIRRINWRFLTIEQALAFVGGWNAGAKTATMAEHFNVPPASLRMSIGVLTAAGVSMRRAIQYPKPGKSKRGPLAHEILADLSQFPNGAGLDDLHDWLGVPEDRIIRAVRLLFEAGDVVIRPKPVPERKTPTTPLPKGMAA